MNPTQPLTEAELHALIDGQLTPERQHEIEAALVGRPEELQRVESYRAQKRELRRLFDPVLDEPLPQRVLRAAHSGSSWGWRRLAAGFVIALLGGAAGWGLRSAYSEAGPLGTSAASTSPAGAFARRAAVAHAVYTPELRRPVEVDAQHEDQLVAWLSKRMGAPMNPPHLLALGYALEGGRLLPGGQGPVAQFMYRDAAGSRLTLYVSNEIGDLGPATGFGRDANHAETAFRHVQVGAVGVFYWVDGRFGYAIAADTDRAALSRVSEAVYRQLAATAR